MVACGADEGEDGSLTEKQPFLFFFFPSIIKKIEMVKKKYFKKK